MIDDHEVVRRGIVQYVQGRSTFELVGEGGSAAEAMEICERTRPDLVILDFHLPDKDGLTATKELRWKWPEIKVLILTGYIEEIDFESVSEAGAAGALSKMCTVEEIDEAIHAVLDGRALETSSVIIERVSKTLPPIEPVEFLTDTDPRELSEREKEVLRLLTLGKVNKEISVRLNIGESSVATNLKRIYAKLDVTNRHGAVAKALRLGLVR